MKVNSVKKARKPQGSCEVCRKEIGVGDSYKYISPRVGGKRKRCSDCPHWRPSEMTSGKIATAYAGQEDAHDDLNKALEDALNGDPFPTPLIEHIQVILNDCAQQAEDCREEYQESLDNMPEGLQEGPTGEDIQEKIEMLDGWQQDLESWEPSNDFDPEQYDSKQEGWEIWVEDVIQEARDLVDSLEV